MKKAYVYIVTMSLLAGSWGTAEGQERVSSTQIKSTEASLVRSGRKVTAALTLDLTDLKLKSNEASIYTPMIVKGSDTLRLKGIGVYGRTRWYQYERFGRRPLSGEGEQMYKYGDRPGRVVYSESADYRSWMNGSELIIERTDYGCCGLLNGGVSQVQAMLADPRVQAYEPVFRYQAAIAEKEKTRELSGRAYIDFPVNLTVIYPDYRKNSIELAKIIGTIDSVRNDKDITVKSLSIKGFASPEGPYDNNIRLAKGRTEALKQYVQSLYRFEEGFIQTSYEPEDWEGLREYVVQSGIPYREGILALIDSGLEPDAKNTKIQTTYPEQYRFLLNTVYPGLRHSDYRIEYTIRGFSDVAEIAEVMRTHPSKLSLNEMYLLAQTYAPGSDAYNEIMETAVRMYPNDETALINAAYSAMQRGDMNSAERYLSKAGTGHEVLYARGVLAGMEKDYERAIWLLEQSASRGNTGARSELDRLQAVQESDGQ